MHGRPWDPLITCLWCHPHTRGLWWPQGASCTAMVPQMRMLFFFVWLCSTQTLGSAPDPAQLVDQAISLAGRGDTQGAAKLFTQAAGLAPEDPQVQFNAGYSMLQVGRPMDAKPFFEASLRLQPSLREAHVKLASIYRDLAEFDKVVSHLRAAIKLQPGNPNAYMYLGDTLNNLKQWTEAVEVYRTGLNLLQRMPNAPPAQVAEMHLSLGDALMNLKRADEALGSYKRAMSLDSKRTEIVSGYWHAKTELCDWRGYAKITSHLLKRAAKVLQTGVPSPLAPYRCLFLPVDPSLHRTVSESWVEGLLRAVPRSPAAAGGSSPASPSPLKPTTSLGIGYVSRRFERYPGTQLMLGLFAAHSRDHVTVSAFAHGPDDHSDERSVVRRDADKFADIFLSSTEEAVATIRRHNVSILVDYDGIHDFNSVALLALRPAAVQATWLGYAGTTGMGPRGRADSHRGSAGPAAAPVDYLFVDPTVVKPHEARGHYSESLVYLPTGCYQPQDDVQGNIAGTLGAGPNRFQEHLGEGALEGVELPCLLGAEERAAVRQDAGLPADAFVFACLNRNNKYEPEAFDDWMAVLRQTPQSVIWLLAPTAETQLRLRSEAAARGVHPSRLHFSERVDRVSYFRRLGAIDLFLDTRYYGSHTVASDSLWSGTPVLTMQGDRFASRVTSSIYNLLELSPGGSAGDVEPRVLFVCHGRREYTDVAVALHGQGAKYPGSLRWPLASAMRRSNVERRFANASRFAHGLERTYETLATIHDSSDPTSATTTTPFHVFFESAAAATTVHG